MQYSAVKNMIDDYESLEKISAQFHNRVVLNQKKLNEIRVKQFQSMAGNKPKINVEKIREKNQEYNLKEKAQLAMLATEMNKILLDKIKTLEEDKLFKDKEARQEKALLEELERERKKQADDAQLPIVNTNSLVPLLVHVDMLLQKQELTEKQKNHLKAIRQNVMASITAI